ncbi:MAG: Smr/MutS family protein [Rhodospirillales bacterium]|jgi:DNA-nicking Smr family endonuclease|nr:Smr/MutS family protein [Rhodospirillales bacterium]HIJ42922.1 hypothetical protein [Rhodospirillaceae bacterium]MDP7214680.1 Smr/MutS family protein [Rhodospirillales bacterium]HIJ45653.1 hypothetical protein [Rhodospirillaceae bacterium]HIJ92389.1 hypothetical protein [Rhodospirillaceae bacterium]
MTKKSKSPKSAAAGRPLSREEDDLWRLVTSDVVPLPGEESVKAVDIPPPEKEPPPEKKPSAKPANSAAAHRPPPPELAAGGASGVDKRTAARLKRGQLPIEASIDLHGMTQDEAHRALAAFLEGAQTASRRAVRVITGKGLRPGGGIGVLRAAVPRWLNEAPNRRRLLAFSQARPKDGGEGALYVLLKKKK